MKPWAEETLGLRMSDDAHRRLCGCACRKRLRWWDYGLWFVVAILFAGVLFLVDGGGAR